MQLERSALETLVKRIVGVMYPDGDPNAEWDPDTLDGIAQVLNDYGLVPKQLSIKEKVTKFLEEREDVWDEYPDFPMSDWQMEVSEGNTLLGYVDWLLHKVECEDE